MKPLEGIGQQTSKEVRLTYVILNSCAKQHLSSSHPSDSYQQVGESTTSNGRNAPNDGTTTRTYNVNNELVQFSDAGEKKTNRYFANNAMGQALTGVVKDINKKEGKAA